MARQAVKCTKRHPTQRNTIPVTGEPNKCDECQGNINTPWMFVQQPNGKQICTKRERICKEKGGTKCCPGTDVSFEYENINAQEVLHWNRSGFKMRNGQKVLSWNRSGFRICKEKRAPNAVLEPKWVQKEKRAESAVLEPKWVSNM